MNNNLFLFELHHRDEDNPQIRYELVYEDRGQKAAGWGIGLLWPSYTRHLLRSARISPRLWIDYRAMCERAKSFNQDMRALIIGHNDLQRWGMAYKSANGVLSAINVRYPLPRQEFILDDEQFLAYAAFDTYTFRQVEAKAYMPRFNSFSGDSL